MCPEIGSIADGVGQWEERADRDVARCLPGGKQSGRQRASVGKISAKCCSFSAVSAPIFARKYAFRLFSFGNPFIPAKERPQNRGGVQS